LVEQQAKNAINKATPKKGCADENQRIFNMNITQINLSDKPMVKKFIHLPFRIYHDNPYWVPPLLVDEHARFNPRCFPFYRDSEAAFFLATQEDEVVGRLAVLNNRLYNRHNHENTAFFYLFECEDDAEVASQLFESAFKWATNRELTKIIGPKGFTALDGFGLLVKGFNHRPALGIPYNPPYYSSLLESLGFKPSGESVSGYLDANLVFPERIHELSERIQKRRGLNIARFKKRSDLKTLIPHLKDLYNGALRGTEGGTPLTDADATALANQILWFADPSLIKIVIKTDPSDPNKRQMVGFLLAYPDISAAIPRIRGRLFPFGWLSILRELKKTDWININGAGLIEEYRGLGGTAILFSEMQKSVVESGQFQHADIVQIGLENQKMQREMENFGVNFHKIHRVYERSLP
jgi:hypothetical protein